MGVINLKNGENWKLFLELLFEHVRVNELRTVTFMADQQKGIDPALESCWPNHRV